MTDVELDARVTALEETHGVYPSNGKYCLFIIIYRKSNVLSMSNSDMW